MERARGDCVWKTRGAAISHVPKLGDFCEIVRSGEEKSQAANARSMSRLANG
jgi:hypothetical protein